MKRTRIMLTALVVLAVVGGALAFKANNAFNGNYKCTAIENGPTSNCPIEKFTIDADNGSPHLCKTLGATAGAPCTEFKVRLHN